MNPAKAAPSAPVKKADEHHGQGGHPGRKMKHKGTSVKSDAIARRTLQNAKKEA